MITSTAMLLDSFSEMENKNHLSREGKTSRRVKKKKLNPKNRNEIQNA